MDRFLRQKKCKGYKRSKAGGVVVIESITILLKGDEELSRERFEKYLSEKIS